MSNRFVVTSCFSDGVTAYLANDADSWLWCEEMGDVRIFETLDQAKEVADEIAANKGMPKGGRTPVVVEMTIKVAYVAEAA